MKQSSTKRSSHKYFSCVTQSNINDNLQNVNDTRESDYNCERGVYAVGAQFSGGKMNKFRFLLSVMILSLICSSVAKAQSLSAGEVPHVDRPSEKLHIFGQWLCAFTLTTYDHPSQVDVCWTYKPDGVSSCLVEIRG